MKKTDFFEGWQPNVEDFSRMEQIGPEALLQRFKTYWTLPGVVTGLLITPGPTINTVSITPGLGYDRVGEECSVTTVQTLEFDNIGGVTYYVRLTYANQPTKGVYHPETGTGPDDNDPTIPYFVWLENSFVLSIVTSPPSVEEPDILLGSILGSGTGTFVPTTNIDMTTRVKALLPQTSLQTLDHTLLDNIGNLTHEELETLIDQLYISSGLTQGEILSPSLLERINTALSGNLDNLYITKTSGTYSFFTLRGTVTNELEFGNGNIVYRGLVYPVDITSSPLGPVVPGSPKLIVGTLTTGPNTAVITLENLSSGVNENQIVLGMYNGTDDLFLRYGFTNNLIVPSLSNPDNKIKITDQKIDSNSSATVNRQLYLNSNQTSAPASVGNSTGGEFKFGSNADTAKIASTSSGQNIIISPRSSGIGNTVYISKPNTTDSIDSMVIRSDSITLDDSNTTIASIYPPNGTDFSGTPGSYALKSDLSIKEQMSQLSLYDNLMIYPENGFSWDGPTNTVTITGGIKIICFFTGAILTATLITPITQQLPNNYDILYVNWNLRSTTSKNIETEAMLTASFFIEPSIGENPNQDEYRIVLAMRVPGSPSRLVHRLNTLLT